MKTKRIKAYVYTGLGFPAVLRNVPTITVRGEVMPDINFNKLQKAVVIALCYKPFPLTGDEIKFIRTFFEMTLAEFGTEFGCSHVAVLKWERCKSRFAKIEPTTDMCIRLFSFGRLHLKGNPLAEIYDKIKIQELAKQQKRPTDKRLSPLALNVEENFKIAANW